MRVAGTNKQGMHRERGAALVEYGVGIAIVALGFLTAFPSLNGAMQGLDSDLQFRATLNRGYSYPKPLIPFASGNHPITTVNINPAYRNPVNGAMESPDIASLPMHP